MHMETHTSPTDLHFAVPWGSIHRSPVLPQRGVAGGQQWKQCFSSGILMVAILQASRGKTWHSPVQALSATKEPLT